MQELDEGVATAGDRELDRTVRAALAEVMDPCSVAFGLPLSLTEMNLVDRVEADDGSVTVWIRLTEPTCMFSFDIAERARERVRAALGDRLAVRVRLTTFADADAIWTEEHMTPQARRRLAAFRRNRRRDGETTRKGSDERASQ